MCGISDSLRTIGFDIDEYFIIEVSINRRRFKRPYDIIYGDANTQLFHLEGHYFGHYFDSYRCVCHFVLVKRDVLDKPGYVKSVVKRLNRNGNKHVLSYNVMDGDWSNVSKLPVVPSTPLYDQWAKYMQNYKCVAGSLNYSIVLHGNPGTGKSTFASNIASLLNYNMYIVNEYKEEHLCHESESVILLEELDKILNDNGDFTIDDKLVSVMLQYLDGNLRPSRSIIIITCNDIKKLMSNEFLSRPGRIDKFVKFGMITVDECNNICDMYYPDDDSSVLWKAINKKTTTVGMISSYIKVCIVEGKSFDEMVTGIDGGVRRYTGGDKRMYH